MKKIALAIAGAAAGTIFAGAASAGPAANAPGTQSAGLVHKTGGVYLEFGGPRYYGSDFYYDRYPAYRYYGPRRYYGYDYGYNDRPYHSRRWTQERFKHPLGRR